ncbi:thiamine pyrophosphate enzyme, N-terminal TPP binding domain-containing protein [Zychaea mexicana]|uniref:thiamine pyrophosphate enzyme, N-terminal TPP binding domain-containing protein n=1 Tax=Zychaea mexicana TaxID=64656 RepID=UPI0022FE844C|nr:thiamine pyrophosphate enzyme, N-terminal TPP binding domain-containing protein [Zychaea mexicana]KAI9471394.1 thiamine pyrophosphate enzyme, N-terminal TPP binding domain-containing protein [Zychaea mexicana]
MSSQQSSPPSATGAELIAATLKHQGVKVIFGIVGIPVIEVAEACIAAGIRFLAFRNEQSAAYAASAYGYLSGQPGVCLTVGGPGVIHALAGVANAKVNCWPMVLLAGSSDTDQVDMGAFQELDQVEACKPYCKYAARPAFVDKIPATVEKAMRAALFGRPGATYVDLPADFIQYKIKDHRFVDSYSKSVPALPAAAPKTLADPQSVAQAIGLLRQAKSPLIIVGKGAAYARAENEIRQFIDKTQIPFLPTPMAKGLISDTHPLCVAAARSKALKDADVVLLLGARLNWILHYGQSPRWSNSVKFIHVDVLPEEAGNNGADTLPLVGDIQAVVSQLLSQSPLPHVPATNAYVSGLLDKVKQNVAKSLASRKKAGADNAVMNYHSAYTVIKDILPPNDVVFVSEGANTMDIARSFFDVHEPRHRLDAGTFATMGVGMGYAIAGRESFFILMFDRTMTVCPHPGNPYYFNSKSHCFVAQEYYPSKRVVSIVGDSAFGFSAMELETAVRSKLPLIILVINNNGIYHGLDNEEFEQSRRDGTLPSTALLPDTRYDLLSTAFGGKGWLVKDRVQLAKALNEALAVKDNACVINVMIAPGGRTKLEFGWMKKSDEKAKI